MNAGTDYGKAISQAKANARLTGHTRYVHIYNGVFWVGRDKLTCHHWAVQPDGTVTEVPE